MKNLHPVQFLVNEAWILFELSDVRDRVHTFALMDAASCILLTPPMAPLKAVELSQSDVEQLFLRGQRLERGMPNTLVVQADIPLTHIAEEARRQGIAVVQASKDELSPFISTLGPWLQFKEVVGPLPVQ